MNLFTFIIPVRNFEVINMDVYSTFAWQPAMEPAAAQSIAWASNSPMQTSSSDERLQQHQLELTEEERRIAEDLENEILATEEQLLAEQRLASKAQQQQPAQQISTAGFIQPLVDPSSSAWSTGPVSAPAPASSYLPSAAAWASSGPVQAPAAASPGLGVGDGLTDAEYNEMLARLKFIDMAYNEDGMQDVLYQLARLMFGESLTHGNFPLYTICP